MLTNQNCPSKCGDVFISTHLSGVTYLLRIFKLQLSCPNAVMTLWLGLGTNTTWLRFGEDDVLARNAGFDCYKTLLETSQGLVIKYPVFVATDAAAGCPGASLKTSSGSQSRSQIFKCRLEPRPLAWQLCSF